MELHELGKLINQDLFDRVNKQWTDSLKESHKAIDILKSQIKAIEPDDKTKRIIKELQDSLSKASPFLDDDRVKVIQKTLADMPKVLKDIKPISNDLEVFYKVDYKDRQSTYETLAMVENPLWKKNTKDIVVDVNKLEFNDSEYLRIKGINLDKVMSPIWNLTGQLIDVCNGAYERKLKTIAKVWAGAISFDGFVWLFWQQIPKSYTNMHTIWQTTLFALIISFVLTPLILLHKSKIK